MNPLFEKFFHAELSADEEAALEALLQSSEEQAWRFGQAAGEIYRAYGLPEPEWMDSGDAAPSPGAGWILPAVFLCLLLGGGVLLYRMFQASPRADGSVPAVESGTADVSEPSGRTEGTEPETRPVHDAVKTTPGSAGSFAASAPPPPPGGYSKPENMNSGAPSKVSGNNLRIVLKQASAGPVTVSVLDGSGREVRRLYNGTLQAGRWGIDWDGRDAAGKLMPPGSYQVEVKTWEGATRRVLAIK